MITSFDLNVHINVGITPELMKLISGFKNPSSIAKEVIKDDPKEEKKHDARPEVADEKIPEKTADENPSAEAQKEITEQDVRAAMARARERIEGEDYKEKTDSEGYKKWHRQLTGWFKNTASQYGAEKPSALPDSESREAFIKDCDAVVADGDKLIIKCPF